MDEISKPAGRADAASVARALGVALGVDPVVLSAALLSAFDRLELLLAVKEGASGRYVYANPAMVEALTGGSRSIVGATDAELLEPAQAATMRAAEQAALTQTVATFNEHRLERAGSKRQFGITRLAIGSPADGVPRHLLLVWVEQTAARAQSRQLQNALAQLEQQQAAAGTMRQQIEAQGPRDAATGLYRPTHFDDQLRREIDLSSREHREFALVAIALDSPTAEVQAFGPVARARVLESLGQLLRSNTRAMDASCRLDDDRFAILLSGVGLATAHSRMEGLRRQCATQIVVLEGREFGFTVSMGVASFPHTAHSEEDLSAASWAALLEAQRRGGNHVALASIRFVPPSPV